MATPEATTAATTDRDRDDIASYIAHGLAGTTFDLGGDLNAL